MRARYCAELALGLSCQPRDGGPPGRGHIRCGLLRRQWLTRCVPGLAPVGGAPRSRLLTRCRPGPAPAGGSLSFAGPNESNQSKGPDVLQRRIASEADLSLAGSLRTQDSCDLLFVGCGSTIPPSLATGSLRIALGSKTASPKTASEPDPGDAKRAAVEDELSVQAAAVRRVDAAVLGAEAPRPNWGPRQKAINRCRASGPLLWLLSFGPANASDPPAGAGPGRHRVSSRLRGAPPAGAEPGTRRISRPRSKQPTCREQPR